MNEVADAPASGSVKSAVRVLELFEFLARWDAAKTHTEIAEELAIPKSSLTQLLKTLVQRNYLTYAPATKRYALGPAIADLARKTMETRDIVTLAVPVLRQLTETTQETTALNVLKGDQSEVMCAEVSRRRLVYTMRVGDVAPLHATSGGKVLLAHLPKEMQDDYLSRANFEPITPNTILSSDVLAEQLATIRQTGLAYVFEEFTPGIIGMARPVLSPSGFPLASINVAIPAPRYNNEVEALVSESLTRATKALEDRYRDLNRTPPHR